MSVRQHTIPRDNPPIVDGMTTGALGASSHDLVGQTIITSYEIPDSDRSEVLLLCESGKVLCISTDPGYNDDAAMSRNHELWEVVIYDATDTEAGRKIGQLRRGQWL